MSGERLSIVVPVKEPDEKFEACLAALRRLSPPPGEIVVVLDGPGGYELPDCAVGPPVRVLSQPAAGAGAARNTGVKAARGDLLLFVDADVLVPADLVARTLTAFEAAPHAAAIFGSYDTSPSEPGFLSQFRNLLHHFVHQEGREEATSFWTGCGAVRRHAFEAVGGFDTSLVAVEDVDLGYRLRRRGFRIALVKDLHVKHLKRWTLTGMLATDLFRRAIPWTELLLSMRRVPDDLATNRRTRASVALACAILLALLVWPVFSEAGLAALLLSTAFCGANVRLLRFFAELRGAHFAGPALLTYWLLSLLSALGFVMGTVRHTLRAAVRSR